MFTIISYLVSTFIGIIFGLILVFALVLVIEKTINMIRRQ